MHLNFLAVVRQLLCYFLRWHFPIALYFKMFSPINDYKRIPCYFIFYGHVCCSPKLKSCSRDMFNQAGRSKMLSAAVAVLLILNWVGLKMTSQGPVKGNKHCTDGAHTGIIKNLACSSITGNTSLTDIFSGRVRYFQDCICLAIVKCWKFPSMFGGCFRWVKCNIWINASRFVLKPGGINSNITFSYTGE